MPRLSSKAQDHSRRAIWCIHLTTASTIVSCRSSSSELNLGALAS